MLGGVSLAAAGLVAATRARRRAGVGDAGVPTEIAPGVFHLGPWGRTQTNAYLVRAGTAWALVDAGWEGDGPRIRAAVDVVLGRGRAPSAILLTHAHPDHEGSARVLAEAWRCPVFIHAAELPLATGDFAAMTRFAGPLDRRVVLPIMRALGARRRAEVLAAGSLAGVVRPLPDDGSVPGLDGWTWVHTPGHTPGHVAYVRPDDATVISGDALLTLRVNAWSGLLLGEGGLSGPPWYTTWDRDAAAGAIGRIAALSPSVLAGGHGRPMVGEGTAAAVAAFAGPAAEPATTR